MLLCHPPDIIAHGSKAWSQHHYPVRRFQLRFYRREHLHALLLICGTSQNRPALWIEKNPAFDIFTHTEYDAVIGDTTTKPLTVPQMFINCFVNLLSTGAKLLRQI